MQACRKLTTYVSLQSRVLVAELRTELLQVENRVLLRINGTYQRCSECHVPEDGVQRQLTDLVAGVTAALVRDEAVRAEIAKLAVAISVGSHCSAGKDGKGASP